MYMAKVGGSHHVEPVRVRIEGGVLAELPASDAA
jgi:hypothetical protein